MKSIPPKAGFTLIELLVVISLILIATAVLFVGGGGGSAGVKLSSAQRLVSSIAQGARGQAMLKNSVTRLIIYSDSNQDMEKKLRYFGIVYYQEDDPATAENEAGWVASSQGSFLPEGIYFNEDLSTGEKTFSIPYPRLSPQSVGADGSEEFFYYEFNSNGTMANGFENSWLVLQASTLKPQNDPPIAFDEEDKQNLKVGLIFRRVGTTTLVNDPSDID